MKNALEDIIEEHERQIRKGWTVEHDDTHKSGEIALAAAAYAMASAHGNVARIQAAIDLYPWDKEAFALNDADLGPREDLVQAGALILAEIERLDRETERERERDSTPKWGIGGPL